MNIIIIGSAHPLRGGLATYNERLAKAFTEQQHTVTIYSFSLQYPRMLFPGKTQFTDGAPPEGINIKTCVNSINPFNWLKIGRELRRQKPDLVIFKYWMPFMAPCFGTIGRIIKKNKHTKIISIIDNIIPHEKRPGDRQLSSYFVKMVDGFIVMSQAVLTDLNSFDKIKPKLYSPHPLFDSFGEPMDLIAAKSKLQLSIAFDYMLFFGFIRDYKGLDLLIEAFADERFRALPVKLIIAGEYYNDQAKYTELIQRHQLEDYIIIKNDFIPNSDVANYFCAADIIVQPYKEATQSGVTQIAYHFNKPMLVTNVGGLPEMVPHGKVGYVVEPKPAAIAEALLDFYIHKKAARFIPDILIEKKKYAWEVMVKNVLGIYNSIT